MVGSRVAALLLAITSLIAGAQTSTAEIDGLRAKALLEGSVAVKVVTRPVADAVLRATAPTEQQRTAMQRAQHKILLQLVSRGLIVGNEINLQSDGSFTMRVLPLGIDQLAASKEVATLSSVDSLQEGIVR